MFYCLQIVCETNNHFFYKLLVPNCVQYILTSPISHLSELSGSLYKMFGFVFLILKCFMIFVADERDLCDLAMQFLNLRHYWSPNQGDGRDTGINWVSYALLPDSHSLLIFLKLRRNVEASSVSLRQSRLLFC